MTRTRSLRQRLLRNAAILGSGNGLAALLTMLAVAVNARALDLAEFGTFALLQSSALFLSGIIGFSTQQPVIMLGTAALQTGDRPRFEKIVAMGLVADALAATVTASIGLAVVALRPGLAGLPPSAWSAASIVAACLALQGYRTAEGIFRAFDRFDILSAVRVLAAGLQLLGAVVLWWWVDAPFVAYGWLAAAAVSLPSVLQLGASIALLRRRGFAPRFHGIAAATPDRREFIAYCWSTNVTSSLDALRAYGDSLMVGMLVSVEAAGVYNVAKQLAGVVRKLNGIYSSVLFPELATLAAQRKLARARLLLGRAIVAALGLTALASGAAWLLGGLVLSHLFGEAMVAGQGVLVLLMAAGGLQLVAGTFSMYVQAFVGQARVAAAYLSATVGFLAVLVPALAALGMAGAGLAQVAFALLLSGFCWLGLRPALARCDSNVVPCE